MNIPNTMLGCVSHLRPRSILPLPRHTTLFRFLSDSIIRTTTSSSNAAAVLSRLSDYPWGTAIADTMLMRTWTQNDGWQQEPSLLPYAPIPLFPASAVLHYGMSVFEGMKVYHPDAKHHPHPIQQGRNNSIPQVATQQHPHGSITNASQPPPSPHQDLIIGRIFRPDLHARRFNKSAIRQALPQTPPDRFVQDAKLLVTKLRDWVPRVPGSSLYLRPVLFATHCAVGIRRSDQVLFLILAVPVPAYFSKPVRLLVEDRYVRSWPGGVGDCKTAGNYALSVTPAEQAMAKGFTQIVWLDGTPKRNITESGVMNFVAVLRSSAHHPKRLTMVTPPLSGLILAGITRQSLLELARTEFHHIMDVEERDISIDELVGHIRAGSLVDCFGTGTAATVSPIHSLTVDGIEHVIPRPVIDELGDTVSTTMRNRILDICHSNHPWTCEVTEVEGDIHMRDLNRSGGKKETSEHSREQSVIAM